MSTSRRDLDQFDAWDAGDVGTPQQAENPLLMVHRALRGRYLLATAVALTLGLAGAAAGMKSQKPTYVSTAQISIRPSQAVAMYEIEERLPMPAFEAFVQQQAETVRSRRVLEAANAEIVKVAAANQVDWPPDTNAGVLRISEAIEVRVPRRTNIIFLSASTKEKRAAKLIASNVLQQYQIQYESARRREIEGRIEALSQLQSKLTKDYNDVNEDLDDAYTIHGGIDGFEKKYADARSELLELTRQLTQVRMDLAAINEDPDRELPKNLENTPQPGETPSSEPAPTDDAAESQAATAEDDRESLELTAEGNTDSETSVIDDDKANKLLPTVDDLAKTDERLSDLVRERDRLERHVAIIEKQVSDRHRELRRARSQVAVLQAQIKVRVNDLHEEMTPADREAAALAPTRPMSLAETLFNRRDFLNDEITKVTENVKGLEQLRLRTMDEEVRRARIQRNLDEVNDRLLQITSEADAQKMDQLVDKLEFTEATDPLRPTGDKSKQFAAAGFMAGFGGTYAAFIAFGLAFPRLRTGDDVAASVSDVAVLGMIPELDGDEEQKLIARECVHLLRTMIEASETAEFPMLTLTSPVSGVGKSTIAFMLAESFAASGRKVLLIDADLTGRGLTARFGLERRLGLSDNHDQSAKQLAVSVNGNGLCVIGGGTAGDGAERMCRSRLEQLVDSARGDFDMAIVDTGPILGSIEAASVVPISDRVLLVAARGMESRMLRIAVERLTSLRAKRVGIVFNRARPFDIVRSVSSQSAQRLRSRADQAGPITPVDAPIEKEAG